MNKLLLEVEGGESSLRTVFEIVEKMAEGIATCGSLSIKKAVIETPNGKIVLDPAYVGKKVTEGQYNRGSGG